MGQLWVTGTQGQLLYSPLLSKESMHAAQPKMRFLQYCDIKEEFGKQSGETYLFNVYSDIDTQGGVLTETATIPLNSYTIVRGTGTLTELGNAIPWTRKYEELSQLDIRAAANEVLSNDQAKVYDTSVEAEFDNCKIRYVGTATGGGGFTTNGTATLTCTSVMNSYHVRTIVDYMFQTMKCDPWDGDNYMAVCSVNAMRGLYDDLEPVMQYTKFPQTGEIGKYYECRFTKTNHAVSNAMGASSAYGEAYFFGGKTVMRGIAAAMKVIPKEETDFKRSRGLAWYAIEGFKIIFSNSPNNSIVKYCSA